MDQGTFKQYIKVTSGTIQITLEEKLHKSRIARGLDGYKDIGYYFIKSMSLLKPGATRCHGTKIARGVPLPVYINLDLYSGFWVYFSLCCV